jgi:uncharacterized membrane protein
MRFRLGLSALFATLLLSLLSDIAVCAQRGGATPAYTYTDLPGLPGLTYNGRVYTQSDAWAINDVGQIVGDSYTQEPNSMYVERHPVIWQRDASGALAITDLLLGGNHWPVQVVGTANGINSQGEVIGYWYDGGPVTHSFLLRPDWSTGSPVWYVNRGDGFNKLLIDLGDIYVQSINDSTHIVAGASVIRVDLFGDKIVTALPGPGNAINNSDQVAAASSDAKPVIWQLDAAGNVVAATAPTLLAGYPYGAANCIDGQGHAAGHSISPVVKGTWSQHATLWQNGTATNLVGQVKSSGSDARGINAVSGVVQVVGYVNQGSYSAFAFLWKNGVLADLNALISASGVILTTSNGINASGQIIGSANVAFSSRGSDTHAFLLTPK